MDLWLAWGLVWALFDSNLYFTSLLSNMCGKYLDESTKTITSEEVTLGQKRKPTGLAEPSKQAWTRNFILFL